MLSDSELQKKVNAPTNKLNAGLFQEVRGTNLTPKKKTSSFI